MSERIHDRAVVVAGHICLDLVPRFDEERGDVSLRPGELVHVGRPIFATGGPVSNTGLALHRLGVPTRLIAKVGDDVFGREVQRLLGTHGPDLAAQLAVDACATTSYTVVISPPGVDRMFLHHPGANQTFGPEDVDERVLRGATLLHFGYPPLMRRFYAAGPAAMVELFEKAHAFDAATSLDACGIDPTSEAGRVDWRAWLTQVMPHTDVFCPSLDELLVMLGLPAVAGFDINTVSAAAEQLLQMGAAVVAIKLGSDGLYLACSADDGRLVPMSSLLDVEAWRGVRLYAPCFEVEVAGTTGAGDSTIAGLLAGMTMGLDPTPAVRVAVGVGACSVETVEAVSGVPHWSQLQQRLAGPWAQRHVPQLHDAWKPDADGVWRATP